MTTTLLDFRLASIAHLAAAKNANARVTAGSPAKLASSAAYLASVSLECVLKARILFRGGFESDDALQEKHPAVYSALFKSAKGHAIGSLAEHLRLKELLSTEGKMMPQHGVWERLTHSMRPYSLRYGAEHLSVQDADAEIAEVEKLHSPLLTGLKLGTKKKSKAKGTRKP